VLHIPEQRQLIENLPRIAIARWSGAYVEVAQKCAGAKESERLRNSLLAALSHDSAHARDR